METQNIVIKFGLEYETLIELTPDLQLNFIMKSKKTSKFANLISRSIESLNTNCGTTKPIKIPINRVNRTTLALYLNELNNTNKTNGKLGTSTLPSFFPTVGYRLSECNPPGHSTATTFAKANK